MLSRVRCRGCEAEELIVAGSVPGPCPECGDVLAVVERVADRRTGAERRGPSRLQRAWDYDPRSWFDRRQG
jgi:predicted RNA-binding Zn-ribbon protein involved in translation (DUF1610 family)